MKTVIDHLGCHTTLGDPTLEINVETFIGGKNLKNELNLTNSKLNDVMQQADSLKLELANLKRYLQTMETFKEEILKTLDQISKQENQVSTVQVDNSEVTQVKTSGRTAKKTSKVSE